MAALLSLAAILLLAGSILIGPAIQSRFMSETSVTTATSETSGSTQPGATESSQSAGTQTTPSNSGGPVTILPGVSIGGIDVSGKTRTEALIALAGLTESIPANIELKITVDEISQRFAIADFQVKADIVAAVDQALAYGQTGTSAERQQAADLARRVGKAFAIPLVVQREPVRTALVSLQQKVDRAPVDASYQFMPSGFTADGTAYTPDPRKLADAASLDRNLERPELVRITAAEMPIALRYLYWNVNKYIAGYIPADASVARFRYTPEATGRALDLEGLADQVVARIISSDFSDLTVKSQTMAPGVTVSDLKKDTMLIASWTSSYRTHASKPRNWNVSRMSSFINGIVIKPGQSWSVNKTAGPRNAQTAAVVGWKMAAGIRDGGYIDEEGGGVCQLGSTTYNVALRGGLTIASFRHHSIPSDYVPLGLDATLSTPAPDLVLKNERSKPVYLVSYVNPIDQNVTVEVYGQQPIDPTYGPVIYDYTSDNRGVRFGTPSMKMIYNARVAPDGTVLSAKRPTYVYAKARPAIRIQTYKSIFALDGTRLAGPTPYDSHTYPLINGTTYVYGPDPKTVTPTPTPSPTPTVTPTATG